LVIPPRDADADPWGYVDGVKKMYSFTPVKAIDDWPVV